MAETASTLDLNLVRLHRRKSIPLTTQLYDSLRDAIQSGQFAKGYRLPSTRELAVQLSISRTTVINAFDQLVAEGYLVSSVGQGTHVSNRLPEEALMAKFHRNEKKFGRTENAISPKAIANYVRGFRGIRCSDDQVMIVNGTQQALDIATRLVMGPGDKVLFESPDYPRAKSAFQSLGVHLAHVPVDQNGMTVAEAVERAPDAKLAYVTPSHQFPLGVTMTIERRMQLIEWANQNRGLIIEDDFDSEFCYSHRPIPSLQGLDSGDRTIYIGSFSKVIYPSLGIGYAVVPPGMVDRFRKVLSLVGRPPSKVAQLALAEVIDDGHFARHLRRMRTVHKARRSALIEALQQHLGDVLKIIGTDAGLHLTALLNGKWNDRTIANKAAELGVLLKPLSAFLTTFSDRIFAMVSSLDLPVLLPTRFAERFANSCPSSAMESEITADTDEDYVQIPTPLLGPNTSQYASSIKPFPTQVIASVNQPSHPALLVSHYEEHLDAAGRSTLSISCTQYSCRRTLHDQTELPTSF